MHDLDAYRQAVAGLSPAGRQFLAERLRELSAGDGAAVESEGGARLLAYVVPAAGGQVSAGALREFLREHLPDYMVPSEFVLLDELPVSPNGKLDRRALLAAGAAGAAAAQMPAPRTLPRNEMERAIAGFWQEVLAAGEVGRDDNFFDLGGHSLLLIQVNRKLKDYCRREIPVVEMFRHPTVATLAAFLTGQPDGRDREAFDKARGRAAVRREAGQQQRALRREHRARASSSEGRI